MPGNIVVTIIGPPGSNQAEVADNLARFSGTSCTVINAKDYCSALPAAPESSNIDSEISYFNPDNYNFNLLEEHIHQLKLGRNIDTPVSNTNTTQPANQRLQSANLIIVYGTFALHTQRLRLLTDKKVFVDINLDTCLANLLAHYQFDNEQDSNDFKDVWSSQIIMKYWQHVLVLKETMDHIITQSSQATETEFLLDFDFRRLQLFADNSRVTNRYNIVTPEETEQRNIIGVGVGHFGIGC